MRTRLLICILLLSTAASLFAQRTSYSHRNPFRPSMMFEFGSDFYTVKYDATHKNYFHAGWTLDLSYFQPLIPMSDGHISIGAFACPGISESWYTILEPKHTDDPSAWNLFRLRGGMAFRICSDFFDKTPNAWDGFIFGGGLSYNGYSFGDRENIPGIKPARPHTFIFLGFHYSDLGGAFYLTTPQIVHNSNGSSTDLGPEFGINITASII